MDKEKRIEIARIAVAGIMLILLMFIPLTGVARFIAYAAAYLIVGWDVLVGAAEGILRREPTDEMFLMTIASLGAFVLAVWSGSGDYAEGVAVVLFYKVGELFEDVAVDRSRDNITELMDIRPDHANIERADGTHETVSPADVVPGSIIVIKPGERVPLDGEVISGTARMDTAALTGESLPRFAEPGSTVLSGYVCLDSVVRVRTTKAAGESTAARILDMVENASEMKSKSENFITRFARVYTPAVCLAALALAVLAPCLRLILGMEAQWTVWLYRALSFLVVSCPCALVISIPLTFFATIGRAGRDGILIKASRYIEALADCGTMVFDKTGTLTEGVFKVTDVRAEGMTREEFLEYAYLSESASSHPISRGLREACESAPDTARVSDIHEMSGRGVKATVDGREVLAGSARLMREEGIAFTEAPACAGTIVYMAVGGKYAGYAVISDVLKPDAKSAIDALRAAGVKKCVMLTGDSPVAAQAAADELGMDEVHAALLPNDKMDKVGELIARDGGSVIFAGDGINDAPVLARADIGIAMGALGSDAAIEAADVVLMDDKCAKIPRAIALARRCMRITRQNIIGSLAIKLLCLALIGAGAAGMWLAVVADVGVMVLAVLNSVRAMR